jgi:hypothetical protein
MEELATKGSGTGGPLQANENDLTDALELFKDYTDELSMLEGRNIPYDPIHPDGRDDFEFNIFPQGMTYIDLPQSRLHIKARILDEAGQRLVGADDAAKRQTAYANLPVAAMFSRIDISLDGIPLSDLSNSYSNYKGYLETMLSYSNEAFDRNLCTAGAVVDTPRFFNNFTGTDGTNEGFIERAKDVGDSNLLEWMSPIHSDFFQIVKYFPAGVKITVKLIRSSNQFVICSSATVGAGDNARPKQFQLKVEQITLYMRHITMNDAVLKHHQQLLKSGKKLFLPYRKNEITVFGLPNNIDNLNLASIINGVLPYTFIVGFIKSTNFYGSFQRNPWFFENFNIDELQFTINGVHTPCKPYKPRFNDNNFVREYRDLLDNTGIALGNMANMMNPKLYKDGLCLWAVDLSPDLCNGYHIHPRENGQVNLIVHFGTRLPEPVTIVVMSLYHAKLILGDKKITTSLV